MNTKTVGNLGLTDADEISWSALCRRSPTAT
jgi:hypothetical protein